MTPTTDIFICDGCQERTPMTELHHLAMESMNVCDDCSDKYNSTKLGSREVVTKGEHGKLVSTYRENL